MMEWLLRILPMISAVQLVVQLTTALTIMVLVVKKVPMLLNPTAA